MLSSDVWKTFARALGVGDGELQDIQARYIRDPEEQRYQMLRTWWRKTDEPTFLTLWEKAVALQCLQLASALCRVASSCGPDLHSSPTFDLDASFGGKHAVRHLCRFWDDLVEVNGPTMVVSTFYTLMFTCACVSGGPMHPLALPNTENSLYISGLVPTFSCMCHFLFVGHTMGIWGGMSGFNLLGGVGVLGLLYYVHQH